MKLGRAAKICKGKKGKSFPACVARVMRGGKRGGKRHSRR